VRGDLDDWCCQRLRVLPKQQARDKGDRRIAPRTGDAG
jgi:hypothetical protein